MKIERLVIHYNKYDFENDGVPAKSYGAKVDVAGPGGRMEAQLPVQMVHDILAQISPVIVEQIHAMQRSVTVNSLIAQDNLLEHKSDEF